MVRRYARRWPPTITDRDREVLSLVIDGLTNAEIGERLVIRPDGVKYHITCLLRYSRHRWPHGDVRDRDDLARLFAAPARRGRIS